MSNVVDLLERMGQSSRLHSLTEEQLAQELARTGIEPAVRTAILEQRRHQLEELIGASKNVCCMVHAPQDDEPDEPGEQQPKEVAERRVSRAG